MEQIQTQVVLAAVLSYIVQKMKGSRYFPWITAETSKVNRTAAIILSGLATLGIHIVCSKVDHTCTVSWVDGMTVATGMWHWASQAILTHGWYKAVSSKT